VIALLRYQTANLLRSHRWILPVIAFALLISVGGASSSYEPGAVAAAQRAQALGSGLDWSAAILVPVIAWLTRSMLTAEPAAARACVAAARGPGRAQLSSLIVGFAGGAVLGLAGACYELATLGNHTALLHPFVAGLGKTLICAMVGSAVGALFNPPLIRHAGAALLSTMAAVVVALVSSISPASAALRGNGATMQAAAWPAGVPLLAAFVLVAGSWAASCWLAGRRAD
jgi:hypothetical protein